MSFSDPFNRVGRKREREYLAFHEGLIKAEVDTEEKARAVFLASRRRMLTMAATVVVVGLLVSLIWPELLGIVIVFGALVLAWLATIAVRGRQMMEQFIQQEFVDKS